MSHRMRLAPAAAGAATLAVLLATTGCGSGPESDDAPARSASGGFWDTHATAAASEVDPPTSIPDLASRSELVVLGTVGGAREGKDYTEAGKPPNRTSNIDIRVEKSSKPGVTGAVVEFTRAPGTELNDIVADLPKGKYVFYLTSWYQGPDGPVYSCASAAKCVVSAKDGVLQTPRDPEAAEELAEGTRTATPAKSGKSAQSKTSPAPELNSAEDVFALSAPAVSG
ncbi:hypothetical protein ACFU5O_08885 [Streptomyces sp. NPDC057445]|uniref:hypothetical protein n=1 Tax=Streptomyces sp. NPDC057445 TaxID=3346136 RepID=UPI003689E532